MAGSAKRIRPAPTGTAPVTSRLSLAERVVGARPRPTTYRILVLLVSALAVVAHVPGLMPVAVAAGTVVIVLTALLTRGLATHAWVAAGALALLPLPVSPVSATATLVAAVIALAAARLVRALSGLIASAQESARLQYGERDAVDRRAQAQHDELTGQVEYWASHDRLTEVLNRSALVRHLEEFATASTPTGVLVVSVAGFTAINDGLGSAVADELLAGLARRLRSHARDTDLVARLGGDEFAIVLPGLTAEHAAPVSQRLLQMLVDPFTIGPHVVPLHARYGLALDDGSFSGACGELLRQASAAARTAKVDGPPAVFSDSTHAEVQANLVIETDLHRALKHDELFLLYQPLVSTQTGRIESVEALVRWQHPERGLVPPDAFIGVAERTGQILGIGRRVLELAVLQLRQWSSGPAADVTVAVNVSARQLAEPGFVELVQSVLWSAGVDPHRILLELTESLLVEDSEVAIAALWKLRGLGVRLALDDFGTGYSSLARLGELPLDELKIDKSFVDRLGVGPNDSTALVTATIAMGHGLGMTVVAEGVETELQVAHLTLLSCDLLQGYWLGRPQTAEALVPQLGRKLLSEDMAIPTPRAVPDAPTVLVPRLMPDAVG